MSDHLPECLLPDFDKGVWVCCCAQLRACQERVWKSAHLEEDALIQVVRQETLQAAHDAVAVLFPQERYPDEHAAVLAAIDALRGE